MPDSARLVRHRDGVPVYRYWTAREAPPVSVIRGRREDLLEHGPHIHDFPVLWYAHTEGVVYVVAAGAVIDPRALVTGTDGVGVFFDPAALGHDAGSPWPAWQAHPLLFPFLHGRPGGLLRLAIPAERQAMWDSMLRSIEDELTGRDDGYRQAALAYLTLLLIDLARLADDVVGDLRRSGEPLLAEVFAVIERRLAGPLSLRDVAETVGMTAGHLTTLVKRRTGRTVGEWITERRMTRARELLSETDLPISDVARHVGILDPGYFTRQFRRAHDLSPRQWRQAFGSESH
ncbi:helix-turn-helix transcriptional regulator [Mycolicibacterium mageritense]|uniref:helix-turn-helix transcriptional regulator n=1 Tax=Mycolicibacterium mageritense TaxID=53462 RepID=UPI001E430B91|nr:AraC family transcriptional regulator [Mycolicibacterium mageritense]